MLLVFLAFIKTKVLRNKGSIQLLYNFLPLDKVIVEIVCDGNDVLKYIFIVHDALPVHHVLLTQSNCRGKLFTNLFVLLLKLFNSSIQCLSLHLVLLLLLFVLFL